MRRIFALAASAAAAATVLAVPGASAAPSSTGDCGADNSPIGHTVYTVPVGPRTFYIDERGNQLGNGTWIYEESNGKSGLQRKAGAGSDAPLVGKTLSDNGSTDTCNDLQGATKPDTMYI